MIFQEDTLSNYKDITGQDVSKYLASYVYFVENDYKKIIAYYKNEVIQDIDGIFTKLDDLLELSEKSIMLMNLNKDSFISLADWNLLESLEETKIKLKSIKNTPVYLRASEQQGQFGPDIQLEGMLGQNKSLEDFEKDLNKDNYQDDWTDVSIYNDLKEEDYTPEGGVLLKYKIKKNTSIPEIFSVLDTINADTILGKDIDQKIQFVEDDEGYLDLKVLSQKDTFTQSVNILASLRKGQNPYNPDNGFDSKLIVGSDLGAIAYPSLFRQIYNSFSNDDTVKTISVIDIKYNQGALELDLSVESIKGSIQETITQI